MPDSPADRLATLPEGEPKLSLGYEVALWGMNNLVQPNGPRAGKPWRPVPSQLRWLLWWYSVGEDGRWLFHHGVRRLAKGSGKSPFAAVMGLAELCGPVRLKDFDPSMPYGCVGQQVDMPLVQIVATAESQTANTMRMVRAMAPKGSEVVRRYNLDPGKTQYYRMPEGALQVLTSSSSAVEGAEASFVIADETEHWLPSNGGPELSTTLEDNLAKSGSRMLETSNAWVPGRGSVAENTFDGWIDQEEGKTRGKSKILYDARIAPPDTDMASNESLTDALKWVYDDCFWADLTPIKERIWDPRSRPDDSKRKYLNWPTASQSAWIEREEWAAIADPKRVVRDGEPIALFFDGSKSRDATALVGCCMSDGHVFLVHCWEPDNSHNTTDTVSAEAVHSAVVRAFDRWDVVAFFADVKEWEGYVNTTWPELFRDKLAVWAVPGGKEPKPIAWDMRTRVRDFGLACEQFRVEVIEKMFTHDGDGILARHIVNAMERPNQFGTVGIGKESKDSPRKIDAAVCAVGARMVRRLVMASKEWQERNKTVERKVLVFR